MPPPITHAADRHCFETVVEGHAGTVEYRVADGVMTITHTAVAPELEGRGIAGALVDAALDHARRTGLKVRPECPYAAGYMQRRPETADLLAR